ncbi:DedA family protein [Arthrobacter deserti]|uniref:DedA family protein n=1 Tax=Arthrobacter deserti TaxID=1742687 RepID=A0ABX1JN88_9MICC|nr:DedA family protein [Arthrobacter deserti]
MEIPDGPWQWLYYPVTLVLVVLDALFPASPSEAAVIGGGALLAGGQLVLPLVYAAAFLGSWGGDLLLFVLFQRGIHRWLNRFRWGRVVERGVGSALDRAGASSTYAAIVAARFIPAGRTASVAAAGLAGVRFRPFVWCSAAGSALWAAWQVGRGLATGLATGFPVWASLALGLAAGVVAGAVIAAVLAYRRRRAKAAVPQAGTAALEKALP